jgi:hypothetical protein
MADNRFTSHNGVAFDAELSKLAIGYRPSERVSVPDLAVFGAALMQYSEITRTIMFYIYEPEVESERGLDNYVGHVERVNDMKMIVSWLNKFTAVEIIHVRIMTQNTVNSQTKLLGGLWALNHWDRMSILHVVGTEKPHFVCRVIKATNKLPGHAWLHWIMLNWFDVLEFHGNLHVDTRDFVGTWDAERCTGLARNLPPNCLEKYQQLEAYHCGAYPDELVCPADGICGSWEDWKHGLLADFPDIDNPKTDDA